MLQENGIEMIANVIAIIFFQSYGDDLQVMFLYPATRFRHHLAVSELFYNFFFQPLLFEKKENKYARNLISKKIKRHAASALQVFTF